MTNEAQRQEAAKITEDQSSLQQPAVGETQDGGEGAIVARGGAQLGHEALDNAEDAANAATTSGAKDRLRPSGHRGEQGNRAGDRRSQ